MMTSPIKITKCATTSSAYYLLQALLAIQILIGAFLIILCETIKFSLLKYFHEIQKNELNIRIYLIEFYCLHLIIFYMCGFVCGKKCFCEPYTDHLKILLKFWNSLIFLVSLEGLITAWLSNDCFTTVAQSIEISLYRGIDSYYENSNWRLIWDNLQFHYQCCGVKDYHDWEAITWLEYEMKSKRDRALTNVEYVSLTPYSCCKLASSCYENLYSGQDDDERSKRMQLHQVLNTNVSVINRMGCLDNLIDRLSTIVELTTNLSILVSILQFMVSILMAFIFVTNRTYRKQASCDGESDDEEEMMCGLLAAQNEELRQKYFTEQERSSTEPRHRRTHESGHHHRRSSSHGHGHRGSSYEHRRSSSHDPSNGLHEEFRRNVLEPAEQFRRSVLAYEQRRGSIRQSDESQRTSSLYPSEQSRRSSFHPKEEPRRSSMQDEHSNSEEFRRSVIEPADEFRRSVLAYEKRNSKRHSGEEPRRSSHQAEEESR